MGFTRLRRKDRVVKYKNLVRLARADGTEAEELKTLKDWLGVAKQELNSQQIAELLFKIYTEHTKDEELANWLLDTYGKEV